MILLKVVGCGSIKFDFSNTNLQKTHRSQNLFD